MKKMKKLKIETGFPLVIWNEEDYLKKIMKKVESRKDKPFEKENKKLVRAYEKLYFEKLNAPSRYRRRSYNF